MTSDLIKPVVLVLKVKIIDLYHTQLDLCYNHTKHIYTIKSLKL